MPNNITNVIKLNWTQELIDRILEHIKSKEREIDFEKIIPMPKHIYRGDLSSEDEKNYWAENCWYQWSITNWGTKRNAYDISIESDTIRFDTAWSHPWKIIKELSLTFPDVEIEVKYADEDIGHNLWRYRIKNWEQTKNEFVDIADKKALQLRAMHLKWRSEEETKEYFAEISE